MKSIETHQEASITGSWLMSTFYLTMQIFSTKVGDATIKCALPKQNISLHFINIGVIQVDNLLGRVSSLWSR